MPEADLIEIFVGPLERIGVRYLVTGSVAATLYGEPRATHDIDLVAIIRAADAGRLAIAFPLPSFYTPPAEVIALEAGREGRGHFNIIHSESGLKADVFLAGRDPLHDFAFRHAREYAVGALRVRVAPPEYVIVRKLEFYREGGSEKHTARHSLHAGPRGRAARPRRPGGLDPSSRPRAAMVRGR